MVAATTPDGKVRHYISFGGVSTANYDCVCNGSESFGAPERDFERVSIPGRSGDLTFDNGRFKDVNVKYALFFNDITEFEDFKNKILALRGAQRLDDTHHPDEYRLATLNGAIEPSVGGYLNAYCSVELNLTLYPQRFLTSGETAITITSSGTITNPTPHESKPLIRVTKSGSVYINGVKFSIDYSNLPDESPGAVYIDSEMEDAYYILNGEYKNANQALTLENNRFPVLSPGGNSVVVSDGLARVYITPRWWIV